MTIITSRQFNQNLSEAQKQVTNGPVVITKYGEPNLVLMSYEDFQKGQTKGQLSIADALADTNPESEGIEFELPKRSHAQRPKVVF